MSFSRAMYRILPMIWYEPGQTNAAPLAYTFFFDSAYPNGIHGGVDFQYTPREANFSRPPVYSPVSGTVASIKPDSSVNSIVITSSDDQSLHRVIHLDSRNDSLGLNSPVTAGVTQLGTIGNIGAPGQGTDDGIHVHYEIYLPDQSNTDSSDESNWDVSDIRIDPEVYWTEGLRTAVQGESAFLEGEATTLTVTINTPHTGPNLWLKISLNETADNINLSYAYLPFEEVPFFRVIEGGTQVIYVSLPATTNLDSYTQGQSRTVILSLIAPQDDDQLDEIGFLHVEAGYATNGGTPSQGNWTAHSNNLFKQTDRAVVVIDDDRDLSLFI